MVLLQIIQHIQLVPIRIMWHLVISTMINWILSSSLIRETLSVFFLDMEMSLFKFRIHLKLISGKIS